MLYGVEINEPYQAGTENKFRIRLAVSDTGDMSWADNQPVEGRPYRGWATNDEETAKKVASLLAPSWEAEAVPVEEGVPCPLSDADLVKAFENRDRAARAARRQIR